VGLAADRLAHLLQDESARHALVHDRGALTLLAEASEMFAGALDVTLATTLLCQLVVPRFGAWAAVYGTSDDRAHLLSVSHVHEEQIAELRVRLSDTRSLAAAGRLAQLGADARPLVLSREELPPGLLSQDQTGVLAVPLTARRRVLGVLLVAPAGGSGRPADEVSLLVDLARRAALAVEGARLYEERSAVAQALQASLLPPTLPEVDGLQFGARYAAAGEGNEVGGDFYDVFPVGDGCWAVAIGDVCGKGPEAATITGLARNVLRLMVEDGRPPDEAFRRLNQAILDLGDRGRFLTATLALLEPYDGGVRVVLAVAGHPPPAVVDQVGQVRFLDAGGTLLGVTADIQVGVEHLTLQLGEQLVLYTDGVTERRDQDRWFGETTLSAALAQAQGRSADAVAGHLEQRVRSFAAAAASDDLAVLVVGAVPRAAVPQSAGVATAVV
jgi:sigma-B regulation protein RsbU (phosphoserine phosphatase)